MTRVTHDYLAASHEKMRTHTFILKMINSQH